MWEDTDGFSQIRTNNDDSFLCSCEISYSLGEDNYNYIIDWCMIVCILCHVSVCRALVVYLVYAKCLM